MVSCGLNHTAIRRCFLAGYFAQAARLHMDGASYRTVRDSVVVFIHPSSVLFKVLPLPPWVFYHEGGARSGRLGSGGDAHLGLTCRVPDSKWSPGVTPICQRSRRPRCSSAKSRPLTRFG